MPFQVFSLQFLIGKTIEPHAHWAFGPDFIRHLHAAEGTGPAAW